MRAKAFDDRMTALFAYARANKLATFGWIAASYLAFLFFYVDWSALMRRGDLGVAPHTAVGRDFANVFTGGHLVLQGKLAAIYDLLRYEDYQRALFAGAVDGHNYSYSPISFLYVWLFALFPYIHAYLLWNVLTGAAFYWAARPYLRDASLPTWVALIVPASLVNVWAGHYGFLVGALWLGAWQLLDSRPRLAGLLVGLMVVKPHLAILMPLLLIRRRNWETFVVAALTVIGLALLSVLLFGVQPWIDYLTRTVGLQASLVDDTEQFFLLMMPTFTPSLFLAGLPAMLVWPIQIAVSAAAVYALWTRMPEDSRQAGLAAACATFLVLPYAFTYDMTAVSIASLLLLRRRDAFGGWTLHALPVTLCFMLPVLTPALNRIGLPLAPVLIGYMFVALLAPRRGIEPREKPRPVHIVA